MASEPETPGVAGLPNPLDFRRPQSVGGVFADNAVLPQVGATTRLIPIAGALAVRLRGKISTTEAGPPNPMGVLTFEYRRPLATGTAYSTALAGPHAAVNVTKDTEFLVDIQPVGEGHLAIIYTPQAVDPTKVTTVTFFDRMQQ